MRKSFVRGGEGYNQITQFSNFALRSMIVGRIPPRIIFTLSCFTHRGLLSVSSISQLRYRLQVSRIETWCFSQAGSDGSAGALPEHGARF